MRANFVAIDIYLQGMRNRSVQSGTEMAGETQLTDWSTAGNLSNRSSGVQIPRDICTRLKHYLYSAKSSWIIDTIYTYTHTYIPIPIRSASLANRSSSLANPSASLQVCSLHLSHSGSKGLLRFQGEVARWPTADLYFFYPDSQLKYSHKELEEPCLRSF